MKITIDLKEIVGDDVVFSIRKHTNLKCEDCQAGFEVLKNGVKVFEKIFERRESDDFGSFGYLALTAIENELHAVFSNEFRDKIRNLLGVETSHEEETQEAPVEMAVSS